jgi:hypothetical protein
MTPLSPAAQRMRRSRELRRKGLRIVQFAVRATEVEALVTYGFLDLVDRDDRAAIARALGRLLDQIPPVRWQMVIQPTRRRVTRNMAGRSARVARNNWPNVVKIGAKEAFDITSVRLKAK